MQKKLLIPSGEKANEGSNTVIDARPHVVTSDLDAAYQAMGMEEEREAEALEWAEATVGDVGDEMW